MVKRLSKLYNLKISTRETNLIVAIIVGRHNTEPINESIQLYFR